MYWTRKQGNIGKYNGLSFDLEFADSILPRSLIIHPVFLLRHYAQAGGQSYSQLVSSLETRSGSTMLYSTPRRV
jgi:hypothetical protein